MTLDVGNILSRMLIAGFVGMAFFFVLKWEISYQEQRRLEKESNGTETKLHQQNSNNRRRKRSVYPIHWFNKKRSGGTSEEDIGNGSQSGIHVTAIVEKKSTNESMSNNVTGIPSLPERNYPLCLWQVDGFYLWLATSVMLVSFLSISMTSCICWFCCPGRKRSPTGSRFSFRCKKFHPDKWWMTKDEDNLWNYKALIHERTHTLKTYCCEPTGRWGMMPTPSEGVENFTPYQNCLVEVHHGFRSYSEKAPLVTSLIPSTCIKTWIQDSHQPAFYELEGGSVELKGDVTVT